MIEEIKNLIVNDTLDIDFYLKDGWVGISAGTDYDTGYGSLSFEEAVKLRDALTEAIDEWEKKRN